MVRGLFFFGSEDDTPLDYCFLFQFLIICSRTTKSIFFLNSFLIMVVMVVLYT